MSYLRFAKVVSSLPSTLTPDTLYIVRTGDGFTLYASDSTGNAAHKINDPATMTATAGGLVPTPPNDPAQALCGDGAFRRLGPNYSGVMGSVSTETLPDTCWGQAVQAAQGSTLTLPQNNPPVGTEVTIFGKGNFTVKTNDNQYIYSPALGLTSTSGPTSLSVPDGGWIELTARDSGEYDVTGGSVLVFSHTSPKFGSPVSVPDAAQNGQAASLGQVNSAINNHVNASDPHTQYVNASRLNGGTLAASFTTLNASGKAGIGGSNGTSFQLRVMGPSNPGDQAGTAALAVPGQNNSEHSSLALYATFDVSGFSDKGPRRIADIIGGFNGGAWGKEYLAFCVGNNGSANDKASVTLEKMRITCDGKLGIGTTTPSAPLDVNGTMRTSGYTVSNLPTGVVGMRAYVTDASSPSFLAKVSGGGSTTCPVFYDGNNWVAG
jgi:hypothetical protein